MPELPEVETVLRTLEKRIRDCRITAVTVRYPKIISGDPDEFERLLCGQSFRTFARRGKYLLFGMDEYLLVCHLRMEGRFRICSPDSPDDRHTHVVFLLDDGNELRYRDTRKFGRMELLPPDTAMAGFHGLGPEPFDDAFSAAYVHACAKSRHVSLKALLLDQSFCAGIGNIYADEILFAAGLRPGRSCQRMTRAQEERIVIETRRILSEAIAEGGTTIHTFEPEEGVTGLFQLRCMVHGRKTCGRCGGDVRIRRIIGRSSYYCPVCQK